MATWKGGIESLPNGDEHTAAMKLAQHVGNADMVLLIILAAGNVNRECACRSAAARKEMLLSLQSADGFIRTELDKANDLLPRIKNKAVLDAAARARAALDAVVEVIALIPDVQSERR